MRSYDLATIAYDAYCKAAGGVSLVTGDPLPPFDALKQAIQDAWWAAADAVLSRMGPLLLGKGADS